MVLICRVLQITKGSKRTNVLSAAPFVVKHLPDFFRGLKAVVVVHHVGDGDLNIGNAVRVQIAVHIFRKRNEADAHLDKQVVDQAPGVAVIAGQPGEVFHHHAVDLAAHNIGQHFLEVLPVGVRSGMAVIHIFSDAFKFLGVGFVKVIENIPLVLDAVAAVQTLFDLLQILLGEPDIACHFPAPCAGWGLVCREKILLAPVLLPWHWSSFPLPHYAYIIPPNQGVSKDASALGHFVSNPEAAVV